MHWRTLRFPRSPGPAEVSLIEKELFLPDALQSLSGGGYLAKWCFSLLDVARPSLRSQHQPSGGLHPLLLGGSCCFGRAVGPGSCGPAGTRGTRGHESLTVSGQEWGSGDCEAEWERLLGAYSLDSQFSGLIMTSWSWCTAGQALGSLDMTVILLVLNWGWFCLRRGYLAISGHIFSCHNWWLLLASLE